MEKILLLSTLLLFFFIELICQNYEFDWGITCEGSKRIEIKSLAIDDEENIYVIGGLIDSLYFNDSLIHANESIANINGLMIAKFNSNGSICWIRTYEGLIIGESIELDSKNNLFITGTFKDEFLNGIDDQSIGGWDFFVAKMSEEGDFIWVKKGGSTTNYNTEDRGYDITIDSDDNVYVVGTVDGNSIFDTDTIFVEGFGVHNVFLSKYSNSGEELWVKEIHLNTGFSFPNWKYSIDHDFLDNVVITGPIYVRFIDTENNSVINDRQSLIQKYSSDGELLWEKRYGDFGSGTESTDLAIDEEGNSYICGHFSNFFDFEMDTVYATDPGFIDGYILKLNEGGVPIWFKQLKKRNLCKSITINKSSSEIIFSGEFHEWFAADNDTILASNFLNRNIYLGSLNQITSELIWLKQSVGIGEIRIERIRSSNNENIYSVGGVKDLILLEDVEIEGNINSSDWPGAYLVKIKKNTISQSIEENKLDGILIYPNPFDERIFIRTNNDKKVPIKVSIINSEGSVVYFKSFLKQTEIEIYLNYLSSGTYFLKIQHENNHSGTNKIIKIK